MPIKKIVFCALYDPKFILQQIHFLNKWFPEIEQIFFVYGSSSEYLATAPGNVRFLEKFDQPDFIAEAKLADRVIFNGLFKQSISIVLAQYTDIISKGIWIPWGGDLYRYQVQTDLPEYKIERSFFSQFVSKLYGIATPIRGDYDLAVSWFKTSAKYIDFFLIIYPFEAAELDCYISSKPAKNHIAIQVGNSGDPSNRHLEIFQWLNNQGDRNIRIYAPLSYGNPDYIKTVIHQGRQMFGDRFVPLTSLASHEVYNRHLASMDVLICNHNRQQALGNISISLYLGTKVFLRSDVTTWEYLTEKLGCRVFDTASIPTLSFEEMVSLDRSVQEYNRKQIAILFDRNWQKSMWENLYNK